MQGMWVPPLVRELRSHMPWGSESCMPQLLSSRASTRAHVLQTTEPTGPGACTPQLERENPHATAREKPVHHSKEPARCNERSRVPQLTPDTAKKKKKILKKKVSKVSLYKPRGNFSYLKIKLILS